MKNIIKNQVVELLEWAGKAYLFSEKDFNSFYRKFNNQGNPTWTAVWIYDCFLVNEPIANRLIIELV